ncbi:MAG: serine/threonine-protein phosphatase [Lentisphaeria bacterium]|nr:serine/threonine-protein phosphatase [Lentisphaeria bacterium]
MSNDMRARIADFADVSETGLAREENEDSLLSLPDDGFFAVSDGMGGASAGATASRIITRGLRAMTGTAGDSPGERKYLLQQTLHKVNSDIAGFAAAHGYGTMGATVSSLLLDPWDTGKADICNIGDSRIYCFRQEELFLLTEDDVLSADPARKHILTNYLGDKACMSAAWERISVCPRDRFLLCTDGLSSVLPDEKIRDILAAREDAEHTLRSLAEGIVRAGAPDNYSAICIDIAETLPPDPEITPEDREESNYLYGIAEKRRDYGR